MENTEIDKDFAGGDAGEKESVLSLGVGESTVFNPPPPKEVVTNLQAETEKQLQLVLEEKEQDHHPERSGVLEWKADSEPEAHLRDSIVYEVEGGGTEAGTGKTRLSFYEVTQQRDQSLYEKASCSSDVIRVWNQISHYIKSKLRQGSGVIITGLGTITTVLAKRWGDAGHFILQRRPVFIVSKILVSRYKLMDFSDQILGFRAPASLMNLNEVGDKAKVTRSVVDGVVTEVVQTFARALACGKAIEFPFPFIGKFQVRNRRCVMRFYAEFYRSMGYNLKDVGGVAGGPQAASTLDTSLPTRNWTKIFLEKDDLDAADILPGRMTPLNTHIPTESFRSVFHLREVRSVNEIITVTEEELRNVDCLQVQCLEPEMDEISEKDVSTVGPKEECEIAHSEFNWCPIAEDDRGEARFLYPEIQFPGEDHGEDGMRNWVQMMKISPPYYSGEAVGEMPGEGEAQMPQTPAPSLLSQEDAGEATPRPPLEPPLISKIEEWDIEPGRPCHHNYRPEPLYKVHPSGNFVIDMFLPESTHYANALFNHHYALCAKTLGISTTKTHLSGRKINAAETVGTFSSFHAF